MNFEGDVSLYFSRFKRVRILINKGKNVTDPILFNPLFKEGVTQ